MASLMTPSNSTGKESRSPQFPSSNSSILLEKATKLGLRRSTPDSEALASSDDEQDPARHLARITSQPLPKPARRPSWINESARTVNRKSSVGTPGLGMEHHSPGHTPDGNTWGSSGSPLARVGSNDNSYPWGSASIWSNGSNSKIPPSRLAEMVPDGGEADGFDEPLRSPVLRRDSNVGGPIPFAIPLKPTPKAYRSQSYSVGQMEQEHEAMQQSRQSQSSYGGRTRAGTAYSGLQQRTSRTNMMGDHSFENTGLEQLQEVDDDDDESATLAQMGQSRSQQQLERENALMRENNDLRQQLVNLSLSAQRTGEGLAGLESLTRAYEGRQSLLSDSVLEDVDDLTDEAINNGHYAVPLSSRGGRRMSEYNGHNMGNVASVAAAAGNAGPYASNRHIDSVRRNQWHSSLGFVGVGEPSQSRRHSFADVSVPKRQISLGSIGGEFQPLERQMERVFPSTSSFHSQQPRAIASSESNRQQFVNIPPLIASPPPPSRFNHQPSFEHGTHHMAGPGRSNLYMVTFKASRAEFYYVPAGIGLEIKEGDLVIVEADRGTDLGTVVAADVSWNDTKKLREQQAEEHYRWLMMFSRRRADGTLSSTGSTGASNGNNGNGNGTTSTGSNGASSSIGSVTTPGDHSLGRKEETEVKPKMIKRLAYQHEIQQLKEKEANEAKAKRICQAKADEHGLDMEILDAEFQMDWKKLTFYYFADAYINFNSLVTDLFKTYKTRIWMSAINPASFQTPPAALAPPSIIGPGAILPNSNDPRHGTFGMSGTHGAGFVGMPARGGYTGANGARSQGGMQEMMQHQFWMNGQGLGSNGALSSSFGYDGMYGQQQAQQQQSQQQQQQQQHADEIDYQRYGGGRETQQPSFAQHLASQQQQHHQQHAGIYGLRGGLY